jgi:hypothetical protein
MKNPYEPIFEEIANALLEVAEMKSNYTDMAMLNVTLIFQSVLMDKLYDNQNFDQMPINERLKMADQCGKDLRRFIHTYTGLDIVNLAN